MSKVKLTKKSGIRLFILAAFVAVISPAAKVADDFFEISKNLEIFSDLYKHINLYYADDTQPGQLMKTGIDAMLGSLDPYTTYIPESKMEDYRFMTTGQYGGIGSMIRTIDGQVYVSEPYQGFPAEKVGLKAGDKIVTIDGKPIADKNQSEISEVLKGSPGTEVKVEVEREGQGKMTFDVVREEIKIPDVPYHGMVNEQTGYIKLTGFTQTASKEVKAAYKELESQGMSQLIFDLRGNGGGLLREAVNIVNVFVPKGTEIVSTKGKLSEWDRTHLALNEPLSADIPVVVLVDGGSASASEIVSGTLQDLDRAVVVGETSFGKGLVQQTKDIAYGSKLKITIAKYYTPSGRCIQKLDYFAKNQGKVEEVPDSLVKSFRTENGRTVFDGRGITPDVEVERDDMGKVVGGLFRKNLFFKYATQYAAKNEQVSDAMDFKLTDAEFKEFVSWLSDKGVEYSTETQDALEELIDIAKKEKYYGDSESDLNTLTSRLKPNLNDDVMRYEDQVRHILESEIISRYHYQNGRVEHGLNDDPYIDKALECLSPDTQRRILSGNL